MSNDYVYDIETYPNVFTLALEHTDAPLCWSFEISDHRNDSKEIIEFLQYRFLSLNYYLIMDSLF